MPKRIKEFLPIHDPCKLPSVKCKVPRPQNAPAVVSRVPPKDFRAFRVRPQGFCRLKPPHSVRRDTAFCVSSGYIPHAAEFRCPSDEFLMGIRKYSNARRKVLQCPLDGSVAPNGPKPDGGNDFPFRRDFRHGAHIGRRNHTRTLQPKRKSWIHPISSLSRAYTLFYKGPFAPGMRGGTPKGRKYASKP